MKPRIDPKPNRSKRKTQRAVAPRKKMMASRMEDVSTDAFFPFLSPDRNRLPGHDAVAAGERVDVLAEEEQAIQQVTHRIPASCLRKESPI
jgi:hypothetical protein